MHMHLSLHGTTMYFTLSILYTLHYHKSDKINPLKKKQDATHFEKKN